MLIERKNRVLECNTFYTHYLIMDYHRRAYLIVLKILFFPFDFGGLITWIPFTDILPLSGITSNNFILLLSGREALKQSRGHLLQALEAKDDPGHNRTFDHSRFPLLLICLIFFLKNRCLEHKLMFFYDLVYWIQISHPKQTNTTKEREKSWV